MPATSAVEEPDTPPISMEETTLIWASPPLMRPTSRSESLTMSSVTPILFIISAANRKPGMASSRKLLMPA